MSLAIQTKESRELALQGDRVWLKDIASAAAKELMVEFELVSGSCVRGFLTGLDELWIQLTTLSERERTLVNIQNIQSVKFMKTTIENSGLNETNKKLIRGYSISFRKTAEEYLNDANAKR